MDLREHYAGLAMAALLSGEDNGTIDDIATDSVYAADALIEALRREEPTECISIIKSFDKE